MWSRAWARRISGRARRIGEQIDSPRRWGLLARMALWGLALRLLRPVLPLRRLVRMASSGAASQSLAGEDVLACLQVLDGSGLLPRSGECLPRALVCYHYLSLAGFEPTLLIGFNGHRGHAWVNLNEQPFLEDPQSLEIYEPTLILPPGGNSILKIAD